MLSVLAIRRFTGLLEKLKGSTFCCLRIAASFMGTSQASWLAPARLHVEYSSSIIYYQTDRCSLAMQIRKVYIYDTVTSKAIITDSARARRFFPFVHPRACVY